MIMTATMRAAIVAAGLVLASHGAIAQEKPAASSPVGSGWSAQVAPGGGSGITLDPAQASSIEKINSYFNNLKTLQGDFVQTGADGKAMRGKFMMMRPGMFRFDYARPSRQVIISDGTYLAIQDLDLNNEDRISLDQTPFRVLLRSDVNLLRDARIVEVQENDDAILVSLQDKDPNAPGRIKLMLSKAPEMQLREWVTTDAQGLDTHVTLGDLTRDQTIAADKFVIKPLFKQN